MIKEDLEDEIKNGEKTDAETTGLHDKELTEAKTLQQDLLNKKTDLEEAISQVNEEIDAHNEEKADREAERDTEIAGLRESIGMLQGALEEANAAGETVALTQ